jgi:hypothetical protein
MIRTRPVPAPRPTGCRTRLVETMAMTMREMAFAGETVDAEALRQRGFTDAAIHKLLPEAIARARRDAVRQIGQ